MDHMVKNCPTRRKNTTRVGEGAPNPPPPPPPSPDRARPAADATLPEADGTGESQTGTQELFTPQSMAPRRASSQPDTEMQTANAKKRDHPTNSTDESEPPSKSNSFTADEPSSDATDLSTSVNSTVHPPPGFPTPTEITEGRKYKLFIAVMQSTVTHPIVNPGLWCFLKSPIRLLSRT